MVQSAPSSSRGPMFSFKNHMFLLLLLLFLFVFLLEGRVSFPGKDRDCVGV